MTNTNTLIGILLIVAGVVRYLPFGLWYFSDLIALLCVIAGVYVLMKRA